MIRKPIVIVRTGDAADAVAVARGQYPQLITATAGDAWAGPWSEHDARTGAALPALDGESGLVLTGSSHSVTERLPWMLALEAYVRDAVAREVPLFGICFGHQIVAQALGGLVAPNPRGREVGTVEVQRAPGADDPLLASTPATFAVNATHVDTVARLPEGARLLASSALDPTQAFAVGRATRCVQFHPEFDADVMRRHVVARAAKIEADGIDPVAIGARVTEAPHGAELLRTFIRAFVRRPA